MIFFFMHNLYCDSPCIYLLYSDCLLPYWCWSGSERNTVAPWGLHCFAKTCRSHRKKKNTEV
jgi:hypothetical protein